jgi:hypothetical protein
MEEPVRIRGRKHLQKEHKPVKMLKQILIKPNNKTKHPTKHIKKITDHPIKDKILLTKSKPMQDQINPHLTFTKC